MKAAIKYPTLEELQQYNEGTLNAMRCHELEYLSLHDEAVADAMEGYALVPSFGPLPPASVLFASSSTTATIVAKSWWQLNGWIVALISGISLVVAIIIGMKNDEAKALTLSSTVASQKPIGTLHSNTNSNSDQSEISNNTAQFNANSTDISNTETITSEINLSNENAIVANQSTNSPALIASVVAEEEPSRYKYVGVDSKYINYHEVLDYSDILASDFPHVSSITEKSNTDQHNTLSYFTFLQEAIALYDAEKYRQAISVFKWLSEHHKNDVNAIFFEAMCAYENGDYESAEKGFAKAMRATAPVHKEPSQFYRAKSFIAMGNKEEAKMILEKIILGSGKYANDASKELQKISE